MDQSERDLYYEELTKNPLYKELRQFIDDFTGLTGHALDVDTTNMQVGGILAREKNLGTFLTCKSIGEFMDKDLKIELPKSSKAN